MLLKISLYISRLNIEEQETSVRDNIVHNYPIVTGKTTRCR